MFDYTIVITIALVGLGVLYFLFQGVDAKETKKSVVKSAAPKEAKKAAKKPAEKKLTKKEKQAIREEEEIIALEVANVTTGMHSDSRNAHVTTLDEYRTTKKEKNELRHQKKGPVATQFTEKQILVDREQGFVLAKKEQPRKAKSPVAEDSVSQRELLDKKLSQFFRSSNGKKKKYSDNDNEVSHEGGRVIVKRDNATARTW